MFIPFIQNAWDVVCWSLDFKYVVHFLDCSLAVIYRTFFWSVISCLHYCSFISLKIMYSKYQFCSFSFFALKACFILGCVASAPLASARRLYLELSGAVAGFALCLRSGEPSLPAVHGGLLFTDGFRSVRCLVLIPWREFNKRACLNFISLLKS